MQCQLDFLDFVLGHYVDEGVDELDLDKLSPLVKLKYSAIADASNELGTTEQIRTVSSAFKNIFTRSRA